MVRPLPFLVLALAVACIALFVLLPLSKIARHATGIEPAPALSVELKSEPETAVALLEAALAPPATEVETQAFGEIAETTVALSGRVGNASGAPLEGLEIELESKGFDGEEVTRRRIISDRLGSFTVQLVPARQYQISIAASGDYAGYRLEAFTDSNASALQNIILERVELVDIDGMIVDTNSSPVADFELRLRHMTLDFPDRSIRSDSSGYFSLKGFPAGEWRIASNQSDYFRIKGIELQPGEYRNLRLMIDRGNYYLSGWVHDSNGTPLSGVVVTMKSAFAIDGYHSFSYRSLESDANGAFEFTDLGGHQVTLGLYQPGFRTLIRKHSFSSFSDNIEIVIDRE